MLDRLVLHPTGHASKNTGGQVQSVLRTVHLGLYWVDLTGARAQGLPPHAFGRDDAQSDCIQALLSTPWYYVPSTEGQIDAMPVLWSCRGSLLWSLSTALCVGPHLHRQMSLQDRCETCVAGFVLWDLWQLLAAKGEASHELPAGSHSMATETVSNLQNLCLSMVALCLGKSVAWIDCETGSKSLVLLQTPLYNISLYDFVNVDWV